MAQEFNYAARAKKLRKKMAAARVDAVIAGGLDSVGANSVYFGEETFPAITAFLPDKAVLYSTGEENRLFDETVPARNFRTHFAALAKKQRIKTAGIDEKSDLGGIHFFLRRKNIDTKPFGKKLEELREIKDEKELGLIKKAAATSAELICSLEPFGKTEHETAGEMEYAARRKGFALDAFPPIVASGANSALPHWHTSSKKISPTDCVVVDAGVRAGWYCGDCSRTFYASGEREIRDAVEAVKEAKKAAERKARPGAAGRALAEAALKVIGEYGFATHSFRKAGLSLGHQIGLCVHEGRPLEKTRLEKGMAFTIEPGVYVSKKFGVRFEDVTTL